MNIQQFMHDCHLVMLKARRNELTKEQAKVACAGLLHEYAMLPDSCRDLAMRYYELAAKDSIDAMERIEE